MPRSNSKHRRKVRVRLFRRDVQLREGRWGTPESPFGIPRTTMWIRCYYCNDFVKLAHADIAHIVARCQGGLEGLENLVLAHPSCNNEDGKRYNEVKDTLK